MIIDATPVDVTPEDVKPVTITCTEIDFKPFTDEQREVAKRLLALTPEDFGWYGRSRAGTRHGYPFSR